MFRYRNSENLPDTARVAKRMCVLFACCLIGLGFLLDTPQGIGKGLFTFITSRAVLVTDYFVLGSIGAAFVNAGLVMFMSIGLTLLIKTPYDGSTVAALFLMPGFALFGKNPVNILPFFLGVFLYARFMKEPMVKYTTGALYSTTLAPIVSELMVSGSLPPFVNVLAAFAVGTFIGFIIVPLAQHLFQIHRGYNLFNYGFACGILAYVYNCIARAVHMNVTLELYWHKGVDQPVLLFILATCAALILCGGYLSGWRAKSYLHILRYHGRVASGQKQAMGIGVMMVNMGFVGLLFSGYILLIGGDLSGPVVGGIFTAIGFAAIGVHPFSLLPLMFGVWLASSPTATAHATAPVIQMAVLFGATALAPIAAEFGPIVGMLAGLLHFALVYTTGGGTGGFNLYNNGFAAGLVAAVLVTLLHAFLPQLSIIRQRRLMRFLTLAGNKPLTAAQRKLIKKQARAQTTPPVPEQTDDDATAPPCAYEGGDAGRASMESTPIQ